VEEIVLTERDRAVSQESASQSAPVSVVVDFADGTRASFRAMRYKGDNASAGVFEVESDTGRKARLHVEAVRAVWHPNTAWAWLGDLEPVKLEGRCMLGEIWPVMRHRNVAGDPLIVGGRVFTRGLGMHATSRVVWRISRPYTHLRGAVALDDSATPHGRVDVQIRVDGETRWSLNDHEAGMPPETFDVAIHQGAGLELFAEAGPEGEIQDRVNWLDMFLMTRPHRTNPDTTDPDTTEPNTTEPNTTEPNATATQAP